MRELEAAALALTPVIAAAIAKAVAPLNIELADLRKCLADRPMPTEPAPVDLGALAQSAAALVVVPEVKDGKDAEPVDLEALARSAAALIPAPVAAQPEHGRDALELEILPTIDEAKQYARGTYAAFRGGLWRSYERTHGMRGWECIVDGMDGVSVAQDGERAFSVTLTKSSGATVAEKFEMPIQIYKGVHRDGDEYAAHDTVTWGGSQWVSNKSANTDKPGSSEAWTLCVKAGRAGKDLRENASTFDPAKGVSLK